jgi:hypothetical protein
MDSLHQGEHTRAMGREQPVMLSRPLVSVVDDDESVRESLPDLVREVRVFGSGVLLGGGVPCIPLRLRRPDKMSYPRCLDVPGYVRTGSATGIVPPQARDSDHLHHR